MTDATIFNNQADDQSAQPAEATTEASLFNALVGEKQKYKSPEDLAKAYANADQFINTLKEENQQLRQQVAQAKTIDEVLERITTQEPAPEADKPTVSGLTPEDVQQLVDRTLEGRKASETKNQNLLMADKLMKEKFGEKAGEMFQKRANTPEKQKILMELAATDPAEFVSLFAGTPAVTNNMDTGSANTTSVTYSGTPRDTVEGTKEWAAKIRKENPEMYWSQEFQYKLQQTVTKNPDLYFGR